MGLILTLVSVFGDVVYMKVNLKLSDYESLNDQFDTESDRQQTEDWFDDEDDVEPEQPGDEDSEDDYMKMDLTKL